MDRAAIAFATVVACIVLGATASRADQVPIPPVPTEWVTDNVGFLSAQTASALNQKLEAYEHVSGHQVIVWIGDTTGDASLEDWTIRALEKWRIGRKGLDDGVILFIFAKDRKIRIEVGYGLESVLTDARASEIIRNQLTPRLRAGDKDGAVTAGVDAIVAALGAAGANESAPSPAENRPAIAAGALILFGLIVFGVVISLLMIVATTRRAVMYNIPGRRLGGVPWIATFGGFGGSDFGGSGGGGGFSAGGGMGGGGGASGGW